jgi:hypothetical protein
VARRDFEERDNWNMDSSTPAPRSRLGLLNAKFKKCFKRNRVEMSSEVAGSSAVSRKKHRMLQHVPDPLFAPWAMSGRHRRK